MSWPAKLSASFVYVVLFGRAFTGSGPNGFGSQLALIGRASHSFVFSCAMICAPLLPRRSLEPVWSGCQCVLISTFTFEVPVALDAALSTSDERSKLPP